MRSNPLGFLAIIFIIIQLDYTEFFHKRLPRLENQATVTCTGNTILVENNGVLDTLTKENMPTRCAANYKTKTKLIVKGKISFGDRVFYDSSMAEVDLDNDVTFDVRCFQLSKISQFIFPSKMTTIPEGSFDSCSLLRKVVFPPVLSSIGCYCFWNIKTMEIYYSGNSKPSLDCLIFDKNRVIPDGVKAHCNNIVGEVINGITQDNDMNGSFNFNTFTYKMSTEKVARIEGSGTMSNEIILEEVIRSHPTQTTSIKIFSPTSMTMDFNPSARQYSFLSKVSSIRFKYTTSLTLEKTCFQFAWCITSFIFDGPGNLNLNLRCMQRTSITSIVLPKTNSVPEGCFDTCNKLTAVTIPQSVSFGNWCFWSCQLLATFIYCGIEVIGGTGNVIFGPANNANQPPLTSVIVPSDFIGTTFNSGKSVDKTANIFISNGISFRFEGCRIFISGSGTISSTDVVSAASPQKCITCLDKTKITEIDLTSSGLSFGASAFQGCTSLSTLNIRSKTDFGENAFGGCASLTDFVYCSVDAPTGSASIFSGASSDLHVYVPYAYPGDTFAEKSVKFTKILNGACMKETLQFTISSKFTFSSNFDPSTLFAQSSEPTHSNMFSRSKFLSKSNDFVKTEVFSSSKLFTISNNFPQTNEFSLSKVFTSSSIFNPSIQFTSSELFSTSRSFVETLKFSQSINFLNSNIFSLSKLFAATNKFSESNKLKKSDQFSLSHQFPLTNKFSISIDFLKTNPFSLSDQFKNSVQFSESNPFIATNKFSKTADYKETKIFSSSNDFIPTYVNNNLHEPERTEQFSQSEQFDETYLLSHSIQFKFTNVFSQSGKLSKSVEFSQSSDFKNTDQFSQSGKFVESIKFSQLEKFAKTGLFSQSIQFKFTNVFSQSSDLIMSDIFSRSANFFKTNLFSKSYQFIESKSFSASKQFEETEKFSKTDQMTESNKFVESTIFTDSFIFSQSNQLEKTNVFGRSTQFEKSNEFSKTKIFSESSFNSFSNDFLPTCDFSQSKNFLSSVEFSLSEKFIKSPQFFYTANFLQTKHFDSTEKFSKSSNHIQTNQFSSSSLLEKTDKFSKSERFIKSSIFDNSSQFSKQNNFNSPDISHFSNTIIGVEKVYESKESQVDSQQESKYPVSTKFIKKSEESSPTNLNIGLSHIIIEKEKSSTINHEDINDETTPIKEIDTKKSIISSDSNENTFLKTPIIENENQHVTTSVNNEDNPKTEIFSKEETNNQTPVPTNTITKSQHESPTMIDKTTPTKEIDMKQSIISSNSNENTFIKASIIDDEKQKAETSIHDEEKPRTEIFSKEGTNQPTATQIINEEKHETIKQTDDSAEKKAATSLINEDLNHVPSSIIKEVNQNNSQTNVKEEPKLSTNTEIQTIEKIQHESPTIIDKTTPIKEIEQKQSIISLDNNEKTLIKTSIIENEKQLTTTSIKSEENSQHQTPVPTNMKTRSQTIGKIQHESPTMIEKTTSIIEIEQKQSIVSLNNNENTLIKTSITENENQHAATSINNEKKPKTEIFSKEKSNHQALVHTNTITRSQTIENTQYESPTMSEKISSMKSLFRSTALNHNITESHLINKASQEIEKTKKAATLPKGDNPPTIEKVNIINQTSATDSKNIVESEVRKVDISREKDFEAEARADSGNSKGGMIAGVVVGLIIVCVIIVFLIFMLLRFRRNLNNTTIADISFEEEMVEEATTAPADMTFMMPDSIINEEVDVSSDGYEYVTEYDYFEELVHYNEFTF